MFCYGYPGDVHEVPVTMGFYATCEAAAPAELREECLSFLRQFADTRIRLATLEWLPADRAPTRSRAEVKYGS